jgi:hypothetical protein
LSHENPQFIDLIERGEFQTHLQYEVFDGPLFPVITLKILQRHSAWAILYATSVENFTAAARREALKTRDILQAARKPT